MIKLELFPMQQTAEIFQSLDIKFCFVNNNVQVSNPIKCRDFLSDCIWSMKNGKKVSIYSFVYDFKTKPYDTTKTQLSMQFPNEDSYNNLLTRISELNSIEEKFNITPTKVEKTEHKNILLITADPRWQSNRWKLSLFTFLLKRYSYSSDEVLQKPEDSYIEYVKDKKLDAFLKAIDITKEDEPDSIGQVHNYSGFVSISKGHNTTMKQILGIV